jgi:hypothetical protein
MIALPKIAAVWLLSALRAFLYSLIVTGESFLSAVHLKAWSVMTPDEHWVLIIGLFIVQAGVMVAFMDKTIAGLSNPPPPIPTARISLEQIAAPLAPPDPKAS